MRSATIFIQKLVDNWIRWLLSKKCQWQLMYQRQKLISKRLIFVVSKIFEVYHSLSRHLNFDGVFVGFFCDCKVNCCLMCIIVLFPSVIAAAIDNKMQFERCCGYYFGNNTIICRVFRCNLGAISNENCAHIKNEMVTHVRRGKRCD